MAAPPPPLPVTRAAAAPDKQQGHGGAGAEVRRAAKALLFLAAVALPCLVLYHRAVVAPGDLLGGGAMPWWRGAARNDDAAADLDTDIVWFRNPLPHFYPDGDFQIACDHFTGDPSDLSNAPNGGFAYVRSNTETTEFYRFWYAARERHPGLHDQDVLNAIKRDPYVAELGVRIRFLSTELFGGLCEPSRNMSSINSSIIGDSEDARLERVLAAAAMPNDTVILTTLNSAWSEPGSVLDVFLESFRSGESTRELLDHLVIASLDTTAHTRCRQVHRHCFALVTDGVDFSGQKNFMTDGYLKMMWRRIDFLREVLEKGFSFVFTDTDIVWFRNPLPHFYPDGDFQIACDHFTGDPSDLSNAPNGGFAYVRSNTETTEFYRFWYAARERHPGLHDQDVLNAIKRDPYVAELGVRIRFLSTELFGGLCEPSRNMSRVCTMHANCCIGLRRKISDLNAMLQDWRRFRALPREDKHSVSWTVPRNCSLRKLEGGS